MDLTDRLIEIAIEEDIGTGDITTDSLVDPELRGRGEIIARENIILAGLDTAKKVFEYFDPDTLFHSDHKDGDAISDNEVILAAEGKLHALLKAERTALNFLQRLSGVATHVRSYADLLGKRSVRLVDTRKTTPGWRMLEKYAVRVGGAHNHRMALYDGILIKDNHIKVCGGIKKALEKMRKEVSGSEKIEVETSSIDEVKDALDAGADIIMLDNMKIDQIKEAIKIIAGRAAIEVSGNVTEENLTDLADTGIDIISVGALTHSAKAVDLSMRILETGN